MDITITGRHLEITPSLKEYVHKKTEKIKYYFEHIINVNVVLEVRKLLHIAELTVISDERNFFCEVKSNDMYESIDLIFDKIERQIRRNKEKFKNRKIKSISSNFTENSSDTQDENTLSITKIKEVSPKPMTEHEAILQLALNNHQFEIFNEEKEGMRESIALKTDNNLFTLIQQQNEGWLKRNVKLKDNHLIELEKNDISIFALSIFEAVDKLFDDASNNYLIFRDTENQTLNILYHRKNNSLGLLTSGGIL